MKRTIVALVIIAAFLSSAIADEAGKIAERIETILSDASSKRYEATSKANAAYRAAVATTLQFADRIEVFLLDFSIGKDAGYEPKDGDETFPIRPYSAETKILNTRKVPTKSIPTWNAAITKLLTTGKPAGGAFCHYPIHGLRIYAGEKLLFETSICWVCGNYYFAYESDSHWHGLTEDVLDLKMLFTDFMPIPETELERFPSYKPKPK